MAIMEEIIRSLIINMENLIKDEKINTAIMVIKVNKTYHVKAVKL